MMFMAPSSIHFIAADNSVITGRLDDHTLDLGCQRILAQNGSQRFDNGAKIQAVKKDGHWFTLNNASLQVYQRLERDGNCRKVNVDVVPLRTIPVDIRRMMVLPCAHTKAEVLGYEQSLTLAGEQTTTYVADDEKTTSTLDIHKQNTIFIEQQMSSHIADVKLQNCDIQVIDNPKILHSSIMTKENFANSTTGNFIEWENICW